MIYEIAIENVSEFMDFVKSKPKNANLSEFIDFVKRKLKNH